MSQPCSAAELVLFDARGLPHPDMQAAVDGVVRLGVLAGAILDADDVVGLVNCAAMTEKLGFWFGNAGRWPFERAATFAGVEPGRTLFVSVDPVARSAAEQIGLQVHDPRVGGIEQRLP